MKLKEIFSKNLKKYRTQKNLTQEKLAELCDFHRTYISSIERGLKSPSISAIEIIAKKLEIEAFLLLIE